MSVAATALPRGTCAFAPPRANTPTAACGLAPKKQQLFRSTFATGSIAAAAPASAALHRQSAASRRRGGLAARAAAADAGPQRQVQVSHILLGADQQELAAQLRQRIQGGEALGPLAEQHSSCPSRSNGGSIGWIGRGQTVPEFDQAAFAAPVGSISVVKTQYGVHVLQVTAEREAAEVQPLTPPELAELLKGRDAGGSQDVQFVDVREEGEVAIAKLPHFQLFPLSKFEEWGPKVAQGELLDREKQTVVLCQQGIRSLQFGKWLVTQGFTNVRSVTGGITAYSLAVDSSIPQY